MGVRHRWMVALFSSTLCAAQASLAAQAPRPQWDGVPPVSPPTGVLLFHTADEPNVLVRVLATGLSHPWSLAFLPDGDMLVTERSGRLRVIRDGVLDPTPVAGVPPVSTAGQFTGLLEVALHPGFAQNQLIYITYRPAGEVSRVALARARFDGSELRDLRVIFETTGDPFTTSSGSRILFAADGTLFMPVGGTPNATSSGLRAQDPSDHSGKILRLRDDGRHHPTTRSWGGPAISPRSIRWGTGTRWASRSIPTRASSGPSSTGHRVGTRRISCSRGVTMGGLWCRPGASTRGHASRSGGRATAWSCRPSFGSPPSRPPG